MSSAHSLQSNHTRRLKLFPVQWCKRCRCKVSSIHKHWGPADYQGPVELDPAEVWHDEDWTTDGLFTVRQ